MNVPYDTASGYRDIEAYQEECAERLKNTKECLMELADELIQTVDKAGLGELHESADEIGEIISSIKYNADELCNIESDYDSTL